MRYATITIPGEANDELLVDFATDSGSLPSNPAWTPVLYGVWLSAQGPTFDWTLFYAQAAAEGDAEDIPILDSREDVPATLVDPTATSGEVINRSMVCPEGEPVPRDTVANEPMQLRVTTFGKTTPGTIRVGWDWKRVP
jgi:hypothetical protein